MSPCPLCCARHGLPPWLGPCAWPGMAASRLSDQHGLPQAGCAGNLHPSLFAFFSPSSIGLAGCTIALLITMSCHSCSAAGHLGRQFSGFQAAQICQCRSGTAGCLRERCLAVPEQRVPGLISLCVCPRSQAQCPHRTCKPPDGRTRSNCSVLRKRAARRRFPKPPARTSDTHCLLPLSLAWRLHPCPYEVAPHPFPLTVC